MSQNASFLETLERGCRYDSNLPAHKVEAIAPLIERLGEDFVPVSLLSRIQPD